LIGTLLLYDALDMSFTPVKLRKNPDCKVCSPHPEITELIDYEAFCGVPGHDRAEGRLPTEWEIEPRELAELLKSGAPVDLIDVPLGTLAARMHELDSAKEIVLFCKSGTRSARALELLAGAGFRRLKNLHGGINAWAHEIDPSLPVY
jgi:rhodanese-related sulfurtransferase